jgi:hypothetical protein
MRRVVFLLEEKSMKVLLDGLLPRLLPDLAFLCVPHEGKRDLEISIPRKLRAWREPGVRFVVVRDNDGGDCRSLKDRLAALCSAAGRADTLVRVACEELEAWYFGEPAALAQAYDQPSLAKLSRQKKYQDSDTIRQPAAALSQLIPEFQKVSGARMMGGLLTEAGNRSRSFQAFCIGLRRLVTDTTADH